LFAVGNTHIDVAVIIVIMLVEGTVLSVHARCRSY